MINNDFWQAAASSWSWEAKPDVKVTTGSGGKISEELLKNPYEVYIGEDFIDFDMVDAEASAKSMMSGGDVVLKEETKVTGEVLQPVEPEVPAKPVEPEKPAKPKIILDNDKFYDNMELESFDGYMVCCRMLAECGLSENIASQFGEIVERLKVLKDSDIQFKKVYDANLAYFLENYIPDALNVTVSYIEYENAGVSEEILESTRNDVIDALKTLLIGINDKIDEIHKFAAMEVKAAAKALNATMEANGYVDSQFKIK